LAIPLDLPNGLPSGTYRKPRFARPRAGGFEARPDLGVPDSSDQFPELRIPRKDGVRGPVVVSRAD